MASSSCKLKEATPPSTHPNHYNKTKGQSNANWSLYHDRTQKHPDDVVITLAIRTPLTKARKGGFKDTPLDSIVVKLLKEVVKKMNMDPALVEDICIGNVRNILWPSKPTHWKLAKHAESHPTC
jgi:hypothetical protein